MKLTAYRLGFVALLGLACLNSTSGADVEDFAAQQARAKRLSHRVLDMDSLMSAFDLCERILKVHESNLEVMTIYSKVCWSIGKQVGEEAQTGWFERGRDMAQKIKDLYPDKPDGYYWYTVNYGEWVDRASLFQKAGAKKVIMNDMNKVLSLDEKYDGGGAYIIIGRINFIAPGGSYSKAIDCFEKSIKFCPRRTTPYLYLGELYLHEHVFDKAESMFHKVLKMEVDATYEIEAREDRAQALKLLKKTNKKDDLFPKQDTVRGK